MSKAKKKAKPKRKKYTAAQLTALIKKHGEIELNCKGKFRRFSRGCYQYRRKDFGSYSYCCWSSGTYSMQQNMERFISYLQNTNDRINSITIDKEYKVWVKQTRYKRVKL